MDRPAYALLEGLDYADTLVLYRPVAGCKLLSPFLNQPAIRIQRRRHRRQMYHQHRHSSSGSFNGAVSVSGRQRASLMPLRPLAALLEQLSLRVSAVRFSKRDVRYELHVEHAASQTRWRKARSFDEYKAFQTQLLTALRLGHFCQAECPWLFTFVKSYFPGSVSFFGLGGHSDCAVEKRRDALEHVLTSLQKFVVNQQNAAACSIVANSITQLVADFVLGDVSDKRHPLSGVYSRNSSSNLGNLSDSVCSSMSLTSDEGDELADEADEAVGMCTQCSSSLDGEAFGASTSSKTDSFHTSSSGRSSVLSYTTTLSCGHRFHDECIVPKLNQEMRCPTCHAKVDAF
ncbi:C3HC4 type zinc finger [Phytophthora infestans]|uniref:C3HC4 type zinc finger n=1 Tax=Phytophthora infestans TaxID=4787 RepID=A0A8S9TRP9_PHYIN|nr:C3HC4 type zinc finger [Phytophthora infestans]